MDIARMDIIQLQAELARTRSELATTLELIRLKLKSKAPAPSSDKINHFLKTLPIELRTHIYKLVLVNDDLSNC